MRLKRHLLTAALALFCLSAANAQLLRTTVEQGEIEGVEHEGFALYKGIPYAEAPVGNLRWKAPVSKKPWKGVFKADKWGLLHQHVPELAAGLAVPPAGP